MSELVTGEAVALELRPAKLPSRGLAVLLDLAAAVTVYVVVTLGLVAATASLDEAARTAVSIATFVLVLVGGPILVETLTHGRSLGKLACGLRVVRDDGGPIRFRHALVRGLLGVIEILMTFGVVACFASLVSARGRRLGDVFAGTLVVRERVLSRTGRFRAAAPAVAGGTFLRARPVGGARRSVARRPSVPDTDAAARSAGRVVDGGAAGGGRGRVHRGAGASGVPPAMFLAAVLHERQTREAQRTFGGAGAPAAPAAPAGAGVPALPPPAHGPATVSPVAPPAGCRGCRVPGTGRWRVRRAAGDGVRAARVSAAAGGRSAEVRRG